MLVPKDNKTVLIAPLDWGLGHATRCIPIIQELLHQGCRVLIAADGKPAALLQQEFPKLPILPLSGYNIRYGKGNLVLQLFRQLPHFFKTIRQEHRWLQDAIMNYQVDGVISDNRYGLYTPLIPCILITHQLKVQAPGWLKWTERLAQRTIYYLIGKFAECWVPDKADQGTSLGKKLSHPPEKISTRLTYIGWLTRFAPISSPSTKQYRLLISLSGPEPQRTALENMLLSQLVSVIGKVLIVRGLPGGSEIPGIHLPNIKMVNHLSGTAMQQAVAESQFFLSRCGYSTLMDLQTTTCQCIFIPTPGQTEQEYLGKEIMASGTAVVKQQRSFNLNQALNDAASVQPFAAGQYQNQQLAIVMKRWLASF